MALPLPYYPGLQQKLCLLFARLKGFISAWSLQAVCNIPGMTCFLAPKEKYEM